MLFEKLENFTNFGATKDLQVIYDIFTEVGLLIGFSISGNPYNFRRFLKSNDAFEILLKNQIERILKNTGKKVLIIEPSNNTLNFVNNLLTQEKSSQVKFLNTLRSFDRVCKVNELMMNGTKEFAFFIDLFGKEIMYITGQKFASPYLASGNEPRPNTFFYDLINKREIKVFVLSIEERMKL